MNDYGFGTKFAIFAEIIIPLLIPIVICLPLLFISRSYYEGLTLILILIGFLGIKVNGGRSFLLWSYVFYELSYKIKRGVRKNV